MPHLSLRVFNIGASHLQPGSVRGPQATPIDEIEMQLPRRWLDVPRENIVVAHRSSLDQRLEHQVVRAVRFHNPVASSSAASLHLDNQVPQAVDPLNNCRVDCNCCATGLAFGSSPFASAAALVDRNGVIVYISPAQSDEFADPQSSENCYVDHRGIRLSYQLNQKRELRRREVWFCGLSLFGRRQLPTLHRILY